MERVDLEDRTIGLLSIKMKISKHFIAVCIIAVCFLSMPVHSRVPDTFGPEDRRISEPYPAKGKFLVATSRLKGSVFEESVILLIEYSGLGATGLIINKPTEAPASEVFPEIKELTNYRENIYVGGPVEVYHINLLIKSDKRPAESEHVLRDIYFSISPDTLKEAAASEAKGVKLRMYIGYAGWMHGQLEQEIQRGSWHVMEGDRDVVFSNAPSQIWQKLIRKRFPYRDTVRLGPHGEALYSGQ